MSAAIEPAGSGPGEGDDREAAVCAWLVARGRLKDSDLGRARRLHEESTEGTLTTLMARLGLVSERDLAEAWAELLQVRRELRDVQFALRHDVENLRNWIRAINIGLIPVLVAIVALVLAAVRRSIRRRPQRV